MLDGVTWERSHSLTAVEEVVTILAIEGTQVSSEGDYRDGFETSSLENSLTSHPSRLLQQHYVSTIRTCIPVVCIFPFFSSLLFTCSDHLNFHSLVLFSPIRNILSSANCVTTITLNQSHKLKLHPLSFFHSLSPSTNRTKQDGYIQSFTSHFGNNNTHAHTLDVGPQLRQRLSNGGQNHQRHVSALDPCQESTARHRRTSNKSASVLDSKRQHGRHSYSLLWS